MEQGPFRFVVGRLVLTLWRTAIALCLLLGLAAALAIAAAVVLSSRGVPERYLAAMRAAGRSEGLGLDLQAAVWRPWSTLRIESPAAWPLSEPAVRFTARSVDVDLAAGFGRAPTATVRRVAVTGGRLLCPPPAGTTNAAPLDVRDADIQVSIEPACIALSASGRVVGLADMRVVGRIRRPPAPAAAGAEAAPVLADRVLSAIRQAAEAGVRARALLAEVEAEQAPSIRVDLEPGGEAEGAIGRVRVQLEGGAGRWRQIAFDRWSADVVWSAAGPLELHRLEWRSEAGAIGAEGEADLAAGRFTLRAAGTLQPGILAQRVPAASNAAPWRALAAQHPPGRVLATVSGAWTNLPAADWSLAWQAESPAVPAALVIHQAALAGSNGCVRVTAARATVQDTGAVLPEAWRRRMESWQVAPLGRVRFWLDRPVDVPAAGAPWPDAQARLQADRLALRGVTLRNAHALVAASNGVWHVNLLNAAVEAPGPDGRLEAQVAFSAAERTADVRAYFRGDPASLLPALPPGTVRALERLRFDAPAVLDASCRIQAGTTTVWRSELSVAAPRLTVRNEPVEALDLALSLEPGHVRARRMHAVLGDGLVGGTWDYDVEANVLRLDATCTADPHAVGRAIGPPVESALASVRTGSPIWLTLAGDIPLAGSPVGLALRGQVAGDGLGWDRFVMQRARAMIEIDATNVLVAVSDAQWCSGTLSGRVTVPMKPGAPCAMSWQVTDAAYPQVAALLGRERDEQRYAGLFSGQLRLSGPLGTNFLAEATGSGDVLLRNGYIMSMPLFGGLSTYLSALIPGFGYAEQRDAKASFTIRNNGVRTDDARLLGRLVSVGLRGRYGFDGQVAFRVEVLFLKDGLTAMVTRLITSPLTKALEFQLTGTFQEPQWWPVNTPTRLLKFFRRQFRWLSDAVSGGEAAPEESAPSVR